MSLLGKTVIESHCRVTLELEKQFYFIEKSGDRKKVIWSVFCSSIVDFCVEIRQKTSHTPLLAHVCQSFIR